MGWPRVVPCAVACVLLLHRSFLASSVLQAHTGSLTFFSFWGLTLSRYMYRLIPVLSRLFWPPSRDLLLPLPRKASRLISGLLCYIVRLLAEQKPISHLPSFGSKYVHFKRHSLPRERPGSTRTAGEIAEPAGPTSRNYISQRG